MSALIQSGYVYELAGLLYFLFYLAMTRPNAAGRFSRRTKALTLIAAIALVGSVPLHYGAVPNAVFVMDALVIVAIVSTFLDRRRPPAPAVARRDRRK